MPAKSRERVRMMTLICKKPGMTYDEFYSYWRDTHSHILSSIPIVKTNLLSYQQVLFPDHCSGFLWLKSSFCP